MPESKLERSFRKNWGWGVVVGLFGCFACGALIYGIIAWSLLLDDNDDGKAKSCCETVRDSVVPTNDSSCSDGNPCTYDYDQFGGCQNPNYPNETPCESACLTTETGFCDGGSCDGDCIGNCLDSSTCPNITGTFIAPTAACENSGCVYNLTGYSVPTNFGECSPYSTVLIGSCLVDLNTAYQDCYQADVICIDASTYNCIISFACTEWAFPILGNPPVNKVSANKVSVKK